MEMALVSKGTASKAMASKAMASKAMASKAMASKAMASKVMTHMKKARKKMLADNSFELSSAVPQQSAHTLGDR